MALSKNQITQLMDNLENCKRPLFLFDDDQDGVCSFLLLYRSKREGNGVIVKTTPRIGNVFLKKVEEFSPDKIFILDIANVEQEFLDGVNAPVIWIDHHAPVKDTTAKYFNPRVSNWEDNQPTSYLCQQVVERDLWLATIGCVADWFIPDFLEEFKKEYPDLIDKDYKNVGDIIYKTKLGHLIRIFSFILKGKTSEVMKCIKILTRIESPYELLNGESAGAKFILKRHNEVNKLYKPLLNSAVSEIEKSDSNFAMFIYKDDKSSFTSDLSNEITYRFPDKTILIGREKNEEMKCSIRSSRHVLPEIINKCLVGLEGYGGGHEHACGLNIKTSDFDEFIRKFKDLI